jgi:hypothetical protein
MCKADAATRSSRVELGIGLERAFAPLTVIDDRLRIGVAELDARGLELDRSRRWNRPRIAGWPRTAAGAGR